MNIADNVKFFSDPNISTVEAHKTIRDEVIGYGKGVTYLMFKVFLFLRFHCGFHCTQAQRGFNKGYIHTDEEGVTHAPITDIVTAFNTITASQHLTFKYKSYTDYVSRFKWIIDHPDMTEARKDEILTYTIKAWSQELTKLKKEEEEELKRQADEKLQKEIEDAGGIKHYKYQKSLARKKEDLDYNKVVTLITQELDLGGFFINGKRATIKQTTSAEYKPAFQRHLKRKFATFMQMTAEYESINAEDSVFELNLSDIPGADKMHAPEDDSNANTEDEREDQVRAQTTRVVGVPAV
jgi:hypothetical protein